MEPHYHAKGLFFFVRQRSSDIPIVREVVEKDNYMVEKYIKPYDIVIDVGGHIGTFSVYAASKGAVVLTYEPVKRNFALLKKNTKINGFNNTIFNMAVTKTAGSRRIFIRDFNFGGSNLYTPHENPDFYEEVTCTTLGDIYETNHLDHCDYLKLDCEGSELEVIQDFPFLNTIKTIGLEYHGKERRTELEKLLEETHNGTHISGNDNMGTIIFTLK